MSNLPLSEIFGVVIVILAYCSKSHAGVYSTCMDSHGSTYTYKSDICPSVDALNMTPEYMYTDRETQRLQMILNQRTVQAEENIARAGTPLPSTSAYSTVLNNDSNSRSKSDANSNADSKSNARNNNNNTNSNTNFLLNGGVFN